MAGTKKHIPVHNDDDIVTARQAAREIARSLGFGMVDQSRIATAVSELTRNIVRYATDGRGDALITVVQNGQRTGIEIVVSDEGPGIENLEHALKAGFSSSRGLGLGLSGTKRLMDEMEIDSALGQGTVVTIRKWLR